MGFDVCIFIFPKLLEMGMRFKPVSEGDGIQAQNITGTVFCDQNDVDKGLCEYRNLCDTYIYKNYIELVYESECLT